MEAAPHIAAPSAAPASHGASPHPTAATTALDAPVRRQAGPPRRPRRPRPPPAQGGDDGGTPSSITASAASDSHPGHSAPRRTQRGGGRAQPPLQQGGGPVYDPPPLPTTNHATAPAPTPFFQPFTLLQQYQDYQGVGEGPSHGPRRGGGRRGQGQRRLPDTFHQQPQQSQQPHLPSAPFVSDYPPPQPQPPPQQQSQQWQQRDYYSVDSTLGRQQQVPGNYHQQQQQQQPMPAAPSAQPPMRQTRQRQPQPPRATQPAAPPTAQLTAQPPAPRTRQPRQPRGPRAAPPQATTDADAAPGEALPILAASAAPPLRPVASEAPEPTASCVVCFQEAPVLSIGPCGHWEVCGHCCLRLRLLFKDTRCPICKASNDEVVVFRLGAVAAAAAGTDGTPASTPASGPDFAQLVADRQSLWVQPKWAPGVLVHDHPTPSATGGGRGQGPPLHVQLRRLTACACSACDARAARPFMTVKQLQEHVRGAHGRTLCELCMRHGHKFPLEAALLTPAELTEHQKSAHPRCQFCRTNFYGNDELFLHMQREHHFCHVCRRQNNEYNYFADMGKLMDHLRNAHYLCEEPECADCQTAFGTEEELAMHYQQRHPRRVARWDPARARPLLLDLRFARPGAPAAVVPAPEPTSSRGRGAGGRGGTSAHHGGMPQLGDVSEAAGGLAVIDDDRGLGQQPAPASGSHAGHGIQAHGAPQADDFPSLQAAGTTGAGAGGASGPRSGASPPALRKITVRCACGRREFHTAARPGEPLPPPLACDAGCSSAARRAALADAFGVPDPDRHTPYFERHRDVKYSPALLQAAKSEASWMGGVEAQVAEFIGSAERRLVLAAMSSRERALVHELAEAYGLATSSTGHEPNRRIQLLKTAATGLPRQSLMSAAAALSNADVVAMAAGAAAAAEACRVRLVDVAPGTNVAHYFREWADHCSVNYTGAGTAVVSFTKDSAATAALAALGGGIRGVFRIDRSSLTGGAAAANARAGGTAPAPMSNAGLTRPTPGAVAPAAPGAGWLVMQARRGGRAMVALPGAATATAGRAAAGPSRTASTGIVSSVVDPWLTADEAALAEKRATEAAILAAHADDFVFESWEEAAAEPTSVFPTAQGGHDVVTEAAGSGGGGGGGGVGIRAGPAVGTGSGGAAAAVKPRGPSVLRVLRGPAPLALQPNPWEVLGSEEAEETAAETAEEAAQADEGVTAGAHSPPAAPDPETAADTSSEAAEAWERAGDGDGAVGDGEDRGDDEQGSSRPGSVPLATGGPGSSSGAPLDSGSVGELHSLATASSLELTGGLGVEQVPRGEMEAEDAARDAPASSAHAAESVPAPPA